LKKTLAAVIATASLSLTGLAVTAPTADATTDRTAAAPCVSKKEYRQVKKGFTKARVHRIFGTAGTLAGRRGGIEARGYKGCTTYGAVGVSYRNGRLIAKNAVW
jgi:hypothetical protein